MSHQLIQNLVVLQLVKLIRELVWCNFMVQAIQFNTETWLILSNGFNFRTRWGKGKKACDTSAVQFSTVTLTNWINTKCSNLNLCHTHSSMSSLLTHTVAYSTRPSFRPKINNQSLKKFSSLAVSWVKVVKNGKILTFKVNFLCQKLSESF